MAEKSEFQIGVVVKNKDGHLGVVITDSFGCCGDDEIPVVYDGINYYSGTDYRELEVVGPENAKADPEKCGAGTGEQCCIFLVVGSEGFECQRFGSMRNTLIFREMKAKRHPTQLYPYCQLP